MGRLRHATARDERRSASALDARLAVRTAAALLLAGAVPMTIAAGLQRTASPAAIAGLAESAAVLAALLVALELAGRPSTAAAYAAELAGLGIVAGVVAVTGESASPYAAFFLFPLVHAAAFQPRWRAAVAAAAGVALYLTPLAYQAHVAADFGRLAATAAPLAVLAGLVVHLAVDRLRSERARLAQREAQALEMAEVDELTGVGNYRRFHRALASECARSRRHGQPFSLLVLDLDGFKAINDELGHQAGDEALRQVAQALTAQLRAEDVLCRQGGDEFAVIAVGAGAEEADDLGGRLTEAVAAAAERGLDYPLSASCGSATDAGAGSAPDQLLAQADRALRESKLDARPQRAPAAPRRAASRRVAALGALARALALAQDELAVVELGVLHVADALPAATVEIWRRRAPGMPPVLVARGQPPDGGRPEPSEADGDGATPDPAQVQEVLRSNRLIASNSAGAGQMLVPISHAGQPSGVLCTSSTQPDATSLERRRLALAMAGQIGWGLAAVEALREAGPVAARRVVPAAARGAATEHVADLAVSVGRRLGLSDTESTTLRRAAEVHDLGLIGVPAGLLLRPARLSHEEARILHEHPLIAERLLRAVPGLRDAARVLRHVHERYDGTGYPDRLAGERIPLASRILHAAITFEAMVSPRPYRDPVAVDLARAELRRVAGAQLDPDVVVALEDVLESAPPAWARGAGDRKQPFRSGSGLPG